MHRLSAPHRPAGRPHTVRTGCSPGTSRRLLMCMLVALALLAVPAPGRPALAEAPAKYVGTYRIEDWRALEKRGLHHFFYLHADGRFLLAASWPGHERSQFVGTWSVTEDRLHLNGAGQVSTNQGDWRTEFSRTYRIRLADAVFVLEPEPKKNRYGLLGWPNAFRFHRHQPDPNLPDLELPGDAQAMGERIAAMLEPRK